MYLFLWQLPERENRDIMISLDTLEYVFIPIRDWSVTQLPSKL